MIHTPPLQATMTERNATSMLKKEVIDLWENKPEGKRMI